MQRRRLNIKLLLWLLGGTAVMAVGVNFLHGFQMDRNAEKLKESYQRYEAAGELRKAKSTLKQYTQLRPKDAERRAAYARIAADITELPAESYNQLRKEWQEAYQAMEFTLQKFPELHDLRRRLIKFTMDPRAQRYQDAVTHLETLIELQVVNRDDWATYCEALFAEKLFKKATETSYELIGFDGEEEFDVSKAVAPEKTKVYVLLGDHFVNNEKEYVLADRIMNQMVEANPDSHEAYLERGRYFFRFRGLRGATSQEDIERFLDLAEEDLQQALEMSPDDLQTNLLAAHIKISRDEWDAASEFLERIVEKHPEDPSAYFFLSHVEKRQTEGGDVKDRMKAALAHVEKGLKSVPEEKSSQLMYERVDLQIRTGELEAARESVSDLRKTRVFRDTFAVMADLLDAKILTGNSQWVKAVEEFDRIRPIIAAHQHWWVRGVTSEIDVMLGSCHLYTGKPDLARTAFQRAFDLGNRSAAVLQALQRTKVRNSAAPSDDSIQGIVNRITALPVEQRDWSEFEQKVAEVTEKPGVTPVKIALLRTQVYMSAKEYDRAKQVLSDAFKEHADDPNIWFATATLRSVQDNPDVGLVTLAKVQEKFGDSAQLRINKARMLVRRNDERLRDDLVALEEGVEQFPENGQQFFWQQISRLYAGAKFLDDAQRTAQRLVKAVPTSLPQRQRVFELALANSDADGMKKALDQIEDLVGRDDSVWQYCEAKRIMFLVQVRRLDKKSLEKAQNLIDQAMKQRPEWNDIHRLQAQLFLQNRKVKDAIASFERTFQYGSPDASSVRVLYGLYLQTREFVKARKLRELVGPDRIGAIPLEQKAIELIGRGEMVKGLAKAREAVSADPENANKHRWIAGIYLRANKKDRAETALREAVRLVPHNGNTRLALVKLLVERQKLEEAEVELQKAHLHLSDDQLPLLLGKCSAILGRKREAEQYFLMAHHAKPDNLQLMQTFVLYYVGPGYYANDGRTKASRYLKKILVKASDVPATDPIVHWARRVTAGLLADSKVHRDILRAMRLMEKNVVNGQSLREDDLLIAALLGSRGDAESHRRAIAAFEIAREKSPLTKGHSLHLALLYNKTGDWSTCRAIMYELYGTYGNDLKIASTLCRMHLDRDEVREAAAPFARVAKFAPNQPSTLALQAILLEKQGKTTEAIATVRKMMPQTREKKDLPILRQLALLLEQIDQTEAAERMYQRRKDIDASAQLELADFYGRHHNLKQAFDILDSLAILSRDLAPVIRVGIRAVRLNRDDVGDTYDDRVQQWLDKSLRENPDSASLLYELSEFYDVQKKYVEAENIYTRLVDHPDLDVHYQALAANNLAFLLALQGIKAQQALEYVEQAIEVMGPTPSLLDTRGCVHTAGGNYVDAIHDIELALEQLEDPSLYFHLAVAQARSGDLDAAQVTMTKAKRLGLTSKVLKPAERGTYEELIRQLESESTPAAL